MINNSQPDYDRSAESSDSNFDAPVPHLGADDTSSASDSVGFGAGVDGGSTGTQKKPRRKPARKRTSRKKAATSDHTDEDSGDGDDSAESRPSRARKATTRKTASRRKKAPAGGADPGDARRADDSRGDDDGPTRKKRSRRRKKKTTSSETDASTDEPRDEPRDAGDAFDEEGGGAKKKRRRRGSRGGRRRRKKDVDDDAVSVDVLPGDDEDLPELPPEAELVEDGSSKKKRRRRRSRGKGGDDDAVSEEDHGPSRKMARKKAPKKQAKRTRSRAPEKTEEELEAEEAVARTQSILVNAVDPEEKRVAVVDGERIIDLLMTSDSQKSLVNDIYRGRVVNLEPAIGAAFVDFGQGRNGFLHTSDVLAIYGEKGFTLDQLLTSKVDPDDWDDAESEISRGDEVDDDEEEEEDGDTAKAKKGASGAKKSSARRRRGRERQPISDLIKVGDQVVVQVTKDAIGDKGPTLTTYISIPGRYLVLMPSMARTGVSRKIPDDKERRRLKRILASIDTPEDMGVIVRTAGVGKTKKDLQRDLNYLLGVWDSFGRRVTKGRGPAPLYQESNVAIRTLRDLFGPLTKEVVIDDPVVYEELISFAEKLMPEHTDRIIHHEGDRPIFHHYGIEQDFEKIFVRRVELPSGGSIVFDQAEALVAIDVNSGRTRTKSFDFEEIALKTNLEAVPEIARQIRLRDLGGIIVCDFIDMMKGSSNRTVERALRTGLAEDRARSKLGRISQFGLLEMTRQRMGPGIHKKVFQACPRCRGTARIRTAQSRAQAILRRLGSALTQKGFTTVEVRAHPEVVEYLTGDLWDYVRALEHRFEKEVKLTSVPDQPEDSVLRYLRADGREVRPGGRRRR